MRNLPNLRDADDPNRGAPYGWDYGHGASRKRRTFQTKKEKVVFKKEFERLRIDDGQ